MHSPPPRTRVASCHCRTYLRHFPTPSGVMLKEHMGSPAMVSAPSCSTTASGLKAAYTSFSTLGEEKQSSYCQHSSENAAGMALVTQIHQCLSGFLHSLLPPHSYQLHYLCSQLAFYLHSNFSSQSTYQKADECKSTTDNMAEGDLGLTSLVVASNSAFTLSAFWLRDNPQAFLPCESHGGSQGLAKQQS